MVVGEGEGSTGSDVGVGEGEGSTGSGVGVGFGVRFGVGLGVGEGGRWVGFRVGEGEGFFVAFGVGEGEGVDAGVNEGVAGGFIVTCGVNVGKGVSFAIGVWPFKGKIKGRKIKNKPANMKSASVMDTKGILFFAIRVERIAYNVRTLKSNFFISIGCTL